MAFSILPQATPWLDGPRVHRDWYAWLRQLWQEHTALSAALSELQTAVDNDLAPLQASIDALQGDIADLEADITAMQMDIGALQDDITALQTPINRSAWTLYEFHPSASSRSTTTVQTANQVRIVPLKPFRDAFTVNTSRVSIGTASAGNVAWAALYKLVGTTYEVVTGSRVKILLDSPTGRKAAALADASEVTLQPGADYWFAFWCNTLSAQFITLNTEAISEFLPTATMSLSGIETTGLPSTISRSSVANDYTTAGNRIVEFAYYSTAAAALF